MLVRVRFSIYRNALAFLTWMGFRSGVQPLKPPENERVAFQPYGSRFPEMPLAGVFVAETFPAADHAKQRLRRIALTKLGLGLLHWIAPGKVPPVPGDEARFVKAVYPRFFHRAWPNPPRVPPQLRGVAGTEPDIVAELAVRGPFASYLRVATDEEVHTGQASVGDYVIDMSWMLGYPAVEGLVRPGGKAVLTMRDGRLATAAVHGNGAPGATGDSPTSGSARAALLAALNEDLTTFRHNISVHLVMLTSFAVATTNCLPATHPVRRLLHHCFHTVLIGNREVAELQLPGRRGFSATIFSHDHHELARMAGKYLQQYDFWDFEPEAQFARRGTAETPFPYPYRDNVLGMWDITRAYVDEYLGIYYHDDKALQGDVAVAEWVAELDRLLPNGVNARGDGVSLSWLTRLCATLLHVSTVEHDYLNNIVWNYSTLGYIVPTVVPLTGERMDQRRAFDLVATIIGTWKPYNMLLSADVPSLALDARARRAMEGWIQRLAQVQDEMSAEPIDLGLSYPANLNVSISN